MAVTGQGTYVQFTQKHMGIVPHDETTAIRKQKTPSRARDLKQIIIGFIAVSGIAFIIGGIFGGSSGEFSFITGGIVAIIAFFVLVFFCYCQSE